MKIMNGHARSSLGKSENHLFELTAAWKSSGGALGGARERKEGCPVSAHIVSPTGL
jgi:hypothetical protein